jgi:DNA polymerase-3 subunit delta'
MINIDSVIKIQNKIYDMLKASKANNRLSHAYLFYGEEGVGKKEMAYALAALLYSNGNDIDFNSVDVKNICENNHLNVNYISVDDGKKLISKEQIDNLQEEYSKTSLVEGPRIYIIDGIDKASNAAQNSLLKFIEDPDNLEQTIGIFIATDLANVVSTIKSRCILQHFTAIPKLELKNILIEDGLSEIDASLSAILTNDIEEAKNVCNLEYFLELKNIFLEYIDLKNEKDKTLFFLKYVNTFTRNPSIYIEILLKWTLSFLEDTMVANEDPSNLILATLYDKIISYKNKNINRLEAKIKTTLLLFNRLNANISVKNIFFEFVNDVI